MNSDLIIAALALITIGGVLCLAIFHFGFYLKDPKNLDAFKRVAADRESAATAAAGENAGHRSLRQRLDDAPSIDARLGRDTGSLGPLDVLFDVKWSRLRAILVADRAH